MLKRGFIAGMLVATLLIFSDAGLCQRRTATRLLAVKDASGAVIPGAGITLTNDSTNTVTNAVSGWDPVLEADKFVPYMPVRNVTRDYPPTLLIHGTADTDVPFEQSQMMAEQLKKHGVAHQFIPFQDAEHGLRGVDTKLIQSLHKTVLEFVDRHMKK